MKHRIVLTAAAIAVPLLLATGIAQAAPGASPEAAETIAADSGSALGNNLLTTGSVQALIGPGSVWSNLWNTIGNSGSGQSLLQGAGSGGYHPVG
ncbi:hypothetical protein [Nocardia sp. NBC_01327]|uniref:hypothetical protein n=1 Tax=Nocardia sp. NBC_01327 TaxID=2903593 RepID=UPI002E10CF3E|nr:hypothetical protein OG326_18760 [Nocardia sp. NBC_01327]